MKAFFNRFHGSAFSRCSLSVVLFVFILAPAVFAQDPPKEGEDMEKRMKAQIDEVLEKMALSDEKSEGVRSILGEQMAEQMAIFKKYRGQDRTSRQQMREEMGALRERTDEALAGVLSEEEMAKYNEIQKETREQRRGQFGGRRGNQK